MRGIVVAGTNSGVGKTTVSLCLASALKERGYSVQPFKIGPDFIDPTHYFEWAVNLDPFMMGEDGVLESFSRWMREKDFAVIEGVMGMYDGYRFTSFSSTAHVAKILRAPVVLVMDPKGMSLSALAIFEGFKRFDPNVKLIGVIFNRCGDKLFDKLRRIFGDLALGYLPKLKELEVGRRHLGLILGKEVKRDWKRLAEIAEEHFDINRIIELSELDAKNLDIENAKVVKEKRKEFRIGIPFDEAFCFYYRDNIELLKMFGDVVFFSPLKGEMVDSDFYYIGGGYPELYDLKKFAKFIAKEAFDGKRIYAECGGMILLSRSLRIGERRIKMANVLDIDVYMTDRIQALGYVRGNVIERNFFLSGKFRGHEFHYSYAIPDDDVRFAFRTDGKGIKDGLDGAMSYETIAGYTHIHLHSTTIFHDQK